jgi:hypothetical protein
MTRVQRAALINDLKTTYKFRKEDLQQLSDEQLQEVVEVLENSPGSRQLSVLTIKRLDERSQVNSQQGQEIAGLKRENNDLKSQLKKNFPTFYNMAMGMLGFFAVKAHTQQERAENIKQFADEEFAKIETKSAVQNKIIIEYINRYGQKTFNEIVIALEKQGEI